MVDSELSLTGTVVEASRSNNLVNTIILGHRHLDAIYHRVALAEDGGPSISSCCGYSIVCMSWGEAGSEYWDEEEEDNWN